MAGCSFLCLCLLLVAVVGHAAAAAAATSTDVAAEAPRHARVTGCWKSVLEMPQPCARDLLETLVFGTVHLGKDCCEVLGRVGEKCVVDVFSSLPFGPSYLPIVQRICGLVSSIV